jgi:5-carboxymethyl-2-hydroxymuconate isomerase
MPQVKIHISNSLHSENKRKMTFAIRELIPVVLNIDSKIGQVMLYESKYRASHPARDRNFVFVEVTMYSGRSHELKQKLADLIIAEIIRYTEGDVKDINLVYYEIPIDSYFGGTTHNYIENLKSFNA